MGTLENSHCKVVSHASHLTHRGVGRFVFVVVEHEVLQYLGSEMKKFQGLYLQ